ncbi:MAG: GIY-YIG nuclease family protein [Planctomycetes bacterium]|nr:GIY-YIG nuclease family protein [Planctomycetota bacterium]
MLHSIADAGRHYVGMTCDIEKHLKIHNTGKCTHTAKYRPCQIETAIVFRCNDKAIAFEKYLKSHSGHAFAKRHFW